MIDGNLDIEDTLGTLTYKAKLNRTWVSGYTTTQWGDDLYEITGSAQGVNIYGNNYAFTVKEPIQKGTNLTCRYISKGILEVQPQGRTFRSINFGDGSCDSRATATIDKKEHNIDLK